MSWPLVGGWRKGRVLVSGLYVRNIGRAPRVCFLSAFTAICLIVPIFPFPVDFPVLGRVSLVVCCEVVVCASRGAGSVAVY